MANLSHIDYFKRVEEMCNKGRTIVCCATCHNDKCRTEKDRPMHKECLDRNSLNPMKLPKCQLTRNKLLYWSEKTGYLSKMHGQYPYIHWQGKPEFIRESEFSQNDFDIQE